MASKLVLEMLESDSDLSDFENEFSDSGSKEELIEEDDLDTKSKQELSSSNDNSESDTGKGALHAKSGVECKETPFHVNVQYGSKKIVTGKLGPVGITRNPKTPSEIFSLFMFQTLINKIPDHTKPKN
ncbi:Hypothetical predicted protein [Octopus vulgaris]|uniref:Uncharacterized protein n=1 Tax=Octopus vulgaris TaxID=6645 RepID=A0AA36AMA8_OCTVU|nr:Hypothetical predicted protein [Octopus vulgaris]